MHLIVDSRESENTIVKYLRLQGVDLRVQELDSGDYILCEKKRFVVERKEATDFVNSIMDRRLFSQVAKMQADFNRVIVIIEGDVFATRSGIKREALDGALSWLSVIEGVAVHHTKDAQATASMLKVMARHAQEGLGYDVALRANKPKDPLAVAQYLVEGLPGVGAGTARRLLATFGSAGAVFAASELELRQVPRVGRKAAAKIRESLDAMIR